MIMLNVFTADLQIDDHMTVVFLSGIDRQKQHLHIRKCHRNVGKNGKPRVHVHLYERFVNRKVLLAALLPMRLDPAVCVLDLFHAQLDVGTVDLVNGNAKSARDKADDLIARQRIAALGKFDLAPRLAVHHDTAVAANVTGGGSGFYLLDLKGNEYGLLLGLDDLIKFLSELCGDLGDRKSAVADGVIPFEINGYERQLVQKYREAGILDQLTIAETLKMTQLPPHLLRYMELLKEKWPHIKNPEV